MSLGTRLNKMEQAQRAQVEAAKARWHAAVSAVVDWLFANHPRWVEAVGNDDRGAANALLGQAVADGSMPRELLESVRTANNALALLGCESRVYDPEPVC